MKALKKLLALTMALLMILSLTVSASAYTIDVATGDTHTYVVYQIFKGDYFEESESGKLSNIVWGKNGTGTEGEKVDQTVLDALTAVNGQTDAEKLAVIETYATLSEEVAFDTITAPAKLTDVPAGYYLIKDIDALDEDDVETPYIVVVVDDATITRKASTPTLEKTVEDINDSTDTSSTTGQTSADHDIGDEFEFQLKGTVDSNIANYDTYKYVFTDTMSTGLSYKVDSVKVTIGDEDVTDSFTISVTPDATDGYVAGATLTVSIDDLKGIDGVTIDKDTEVIVTYTVKLNENAVIGPDGNKNSAKLEYSNKPGTDDTGETTPDTSIVFTYKGIVNKVDDNDDALAGAEFTLEKKLQNGSWETITVVKNDEGTVFTFNGLDDGNYRLTETETPSGYNTADPIYFTVTATHDDNGVSELTVTIKTDDTFATEKTGEGAATITSDKVSGELETDVVNKEGLVLPETGGIGTTIFYIVGGLLTLAAVVLLVTKKKMSAAE